MNETSGTKVRITDADAEAAKAAVEGPIPPGWFRLRVRLENGREGDDAVWADQVTLVSEGELRERPVADLAMAYGSAPFAAVRAALARRGGEER